MTRPTRILGLKAIVAGAAALAACASTRPAAHPAADEHAGEHAQLGYAGMNGGGDAHAQHQGQAQPAAAVDPHAAHGHHGGGAEANGVAYYALGGSSKPLPALNETFRVVRVFPAPDGFVGHLTYDAEARRLWLISLGPPANTRGPSTLYELDPDSGRLLSQHALPFRGEFGGPLARDGYLWVGVYHERTLYKIALRDPARRGQVVERVALTPLSELDLHAHRDKVFRFPYFTFAALVAAPGGKLVTHSDDLGELLTIDPASGQVLRQVPTQPTLEGMTAVPGPNGEFLVLANADPHAFAMKDTLRRFLFRGSATAAPMAVAAPVEEGGITWMLLDPESGEVLSSIWHSPSRARAAGIALVAHEAVNGTPYGRYRFFALGNEGILTIEWAPSNVAWSVVDRGRTPQR